LLEAGGWDPLVLPAIAPADRSIPVIPGTYEWKAGECLEPARQPLHVLNDQKQQMGFEKFSAQYLQDPLPAFGNLLKRTWLRRFTSFTRHDGDVIVLSWDTAMKSTPGSNYSVGLTFAVRNRNEYYLLDVYRARLDFPQLVSAAKMQTNKWLPNAILIENQASGISLIAQLQHEGVQGIIPIQPVKSKLQRMEGETAKLEAGSLFVPEEAPWSEDFVKEYLAFPNGKHDDQIDALSQFLSWQGGRGLPIFECDFDNNDLTSYGGLDSTGTSRLGAPSPEELLWYSRR
jgi:predicted phage terminase large subunit-like protein